MSTSLEIRELRRKLGTQQQVADALGISRRSVTTYEKDPERAPAWYRLALVGLAAKKEPETGGPGLTN